MKNNKTIKYRPCTEEQNNNFNRDIFNSTLEGPNKQDWLKECKQTMEKTFDPYPEKEYHEDEQIHRRINRTKRFLQKARRLRKHRILNKNDKEEQKRR